MGLLITEWWDRMQEAMQSTDYQPKLLLYSGHDYSVMPFNAAFGFWNDLWAPYASFVLFELYSSDGTFLVRAIYEGSPVLIPGCSNILCDISEFTNIITNLIPDVSDCYNTSIPYVPPHNLHSIYGTHFIRHAENYHH